MVTDDPSECPSTRTFVFIASMYVVCLLEESGLGDGRPLLAGGEAAENDHHNYISCYSNAINKRVAIKHSLSDL